MQELESIKPKKKLLVFDLVEQAGFNMSDWVDSSKDPRGPKADPKYCYEWAFLEPGVAVVLNLWHEAMVVEDGAIVQRGNFREEANSHRGPEGKFQWLRRATKLDDTLQIALKYNLPVRVIVNAAVRRKRGDTHSNPSRVLKRELDPEPWSIVWYNWQTGDHSIRRGIIDQDFVDQFDIEQSQKLSPQRRTQIGSVFIRDPNTRAKVKQRSMGCCEFCGDQGFKMANGALYLETHHVIPLAEGGSDTVENMIALCPRDHRMAHYSHDASSMRSKMLAKLAGR